MVMIVIDEASNYVTMPELVNIMVDRHGVSASYVRSLINSEKMREQREAIEIMGSKINMRSNSVADLDYLTSLNSKITEHLSSREQVTVNGNQTQGSEPVYFGMVGDSFTATCDIVDSQGVLQTQLDQVTQGYPPILALPVVKVIAGDLTKAVDEVYMNTTLVSGVLTAIGKFPTAGNWVLAKDRVNMALSEIGANWRVNIQDFSFRIVEKQV